MTNTDVIDPAVLIMVLRARLTLVCEKHPTWVGSPASPKQLQIVNIALQEIIGNDRDDRIRVLQAIFPEGVEQGDDGEPITCQLLSSSHLSKAQASVLIRTLYNLTSKDDFYVGRPLYQRAIDYFVAMVEWTKRPVEQFALF